MSIGMYIDGDHGARVPERGLWSSVLALAVKDAFSGRSIHAEEARNFLLNGGRWFEQVCDMAGVDPKWLRSSVYKAIGNPLKARHIYEIGKRLEKRK